MNSNNSSQTDDASDDSSSSDLSIKPSHSLKFAPYLGGLLIEAALFLLLQKGDIYLNQFYFITLAVLCLTGFAVYYKENQRSMIENPSNHNDQIVSQRNSNVISESFSSSSSNNSKKFKSTNQDKQPKKKNSPKKLRNGPKEELKKKPPLKETSTEQEEQIKHIIKKTNSNKFNNKNSSEIIKQDNKKSPEPIKKENQKPKPFYKKLPELIKKKEEETSILITFIFENSKEFDPIQKTLNFNTVIRDIKQNIIDEYRIKSDILIKYQKKDGTKSPIDPSKTIYNILSKIRGKYSNFLYIEILSPPPEFEYSFDEIDFEDISESTKDSTIKTKGKTKSLRRIKPKVSDVVDPNELDEKKSINEFIKCNEKFIEKYPQTRFLKPKTEALFAFSTIFKPSIDDYRLPIYDNSITIGEIKALVSNSFPKNYGPKRICLKYNDIEIKDDNSTFKKLKYKKGQAIEVSIKNKTYSIRKNDKIVKIETNYYDDLTVKYLEKEIKMKAGEQLKLRNKVLKSSEKLDNLHISNDDIIQLEKIDETKGDRKQITFVIYRNNKKSRNIKLGYKKNIADYQEELDIDINEYTFISSQGKIIKDTINLDDKRIVYAFPINDETDDNYLYESAKSVFRIEKPQIKINKIEVRNIDEYDDPSERIMIDYDKVKGPNTIGDLTLQVSKKLGFTKREDIEKISLFIKFREKDVCNFALLDDNDDIASVLIDNPGMFISYKIIKDKKTPRKNMMKKLKEQVKEKGLDLSDDDIINIHIKTHGNLDYIMSTFAYIASK